MAQTLTSQFKKKTRGKQEKYFTRAAVGDRISNGRHESVRSHAVMSFPFRGNLFRENFLNRLGVFRRTIVPPNETENPRKLSRVGIGAMVIGVASLCPSSQRHLLSWPLKKLAESFKGAIISVWESLQGYMQIRVMRSVAVIRMM